MMLAIVIDAKYESLKPSAKVIALENLAGFLGLHTVRDAIHPGPDQPRYRDSRSTFLSLYYIPFVRSLSTAFRPRPALPLSFGLIKSRDARAQECFV